MRLIDADALIFELEEWKKNPNNDDSSVDMVNHFIGIIKSLPSAEQVIGKLKNPCDSLLKDDSAECKEQKSKLESADAEPKWNCTANFVAEQLERLRNMTDEERWDFFIKFFSPSAEAGWIPCSERLPEKDDLVLVTVWNDVTIAWRNIYGGWESAEDMYEKGDVIAWMPLPSPYREDGEE